jgi:hypothetical protein
MPPPIEPTYFPTFERTGSNLPGIGNFDLRTPRGVVQVEEAPGATCVAISRGDNPAVVGVVVYDPDPEKCDGVGWGLLCQMDGSSARSFAAALLRLADRLYPIDAATTN